jgi:hypothetical protein
MAPPRKFIQVEPGVWEVVEVTPKIKRRPISTKQPTESRPKGVYLTEDETAVIDERRQVVSSRVLVIKRSPQVGRWEKLFLRYQVGDQIFSGHTVQTPANRVTFTLTKFRYLDQELDRTLRLCRYCHDRFVWSPGQRRTSICPACTTERQNVIKAKRLAAQRHCRTEGCGRLLSKHNKTGICIRCYRRQGDFSVVSHEFNPFYGRMVKVNRVDASETGSKN